METHVTLAEKNIQNTVCKNEYVEVKEEVDNITMDLVTHELSFDEIKCEMSINEEDTISRLETNGSGNKEYVEVKKEADDITLDLIKHELPVDEIKYEINVNMKDSISRPDNKPSEEMLLDSEKTEVNKDDKVPCEEENLNKSEIIDKKLYKCEICEKEFTKNGYLLRHKLIHTGEVEDLETNNKTDIEFAYIKQEPSLDLIKDETCTDFENVEIKVENNISGEVEHIQINNKTDIEFAYIKQEPSLDLIKDETCTDCANVEIKVENNISDDSEQFSIKLEDTSCIKSEDFVAEPKWENICRRQEEKEHSNKLEDTNGKNFIISEDTFEWKNAGTKPYKCSICNKDYKTAVTLNIHERRHTGYNLQNCEFCDKKFVYARGLKEHIRTHTGEKPYTCTVCKKSFCQTANLKSHMRTHTGEKPYACTMCKKNFRQPSNLKYHMRIHIKEKPHKCKECNQRFRTKDNLLDHYERIHGKPYKCNECRISFSEESGLAKHVCIYIKRSSMNIKSENMNLTCDICGYTCRFPSGLRQHKQSHRELKRLEAVHLQKNS